MVIGAGYTLRGHWWARLRKPPITEERNAICCTCCHACTPKPPQHESGIQYRRCCYCRRAVAPEGHNGSVVHGARLSVGSTCISGRRPPHTCSFHGGCSEQESAVYVTRTFNIRSRKFPRTSARPDTGGTDVAPDPPPRALP